MAPSFRVSRLGFSLGPFGFLALLLTLSTGAASGHGSRGLHDDSTRFGGTWKIDKKRSTAIDPWKDLTVEIEASENRLTLKRIWKGHYGFSAVDSIRIPIDENPHPVSPQMWPDNRHIGVFVDPEDEASVSAMWLNSGRTLQVTTRMTASVSQGKAKLRTHSEYRLSPSGEELIILELRSTRPQPIRYVLTRAMPPEN